jgi:hypothetical protein
MKTLITRGSRIKNLVVVEIRTTDVVLKSDSGANLVLSLKDTEILFGF